jgi:hypothetical protein
MRFHPPRDLSGERTAEASASERIRAPNAVAQPSLGEQQMRRNATLLVSAVLAVGALAACSKPASQTASNVEASAGDAANAGANAAGDAAGGTMAAGGAVSPPTSPENGAVNTDANKTEATQTPGSNSFTEGQAKGHIENAGYTDVTGLTKTPDGLWSGSAKKDGKTVQVTVDFRGAVSAK